MIIATHFPHFSADTSMKTEAEITHNAKVKLYPDGTAKLIVASSPIFRAAGWEPTATQRSNAGERCGQPDERARTDSVRRSRQKVFDLAALNEWELFVTLTLDKERIDRYDPSAVAGRVKKWLDNGVQRHGWRYLLIPELHRDGAVHMHGLFSGGLRLVDSGHKTARGQTIYNLPQWRYGFTTAMEVYGRGLAAISRNTSPRTCA